MHKLLLTILLSFMTLTCSGQQRRALLVGVARYPENSGWREIHSDNDVALLKSTLEKSFSTISLVNDKATCSRIKEQLKKLKNSTHAGDTVLISFSCHGQQMLSAGSEEPDSLDEALIPYDAFEKYSEGYHGQNHLKDDFVAESVKGIREKAGSTGFVLVLLDACHSGDSYRDSKDRDNNSAFYRGGYPVFGPNSDKIAPVRRDLRKIVQIDKSHELSEVLFISACQSYQINAETQQDNKWYGSLVYSFCEIYKNHGLSDLNILCSEIKNKVLSYNKISKQMPEFATSMDITLKPENDETAESCEGNCGDDCECSYDCQCSSESDYTLIFIATFIAFVVVILLYVWKRK